MAHFSTSPLKVLDSSAVGIPTENYKESQFRGLSAEKFENMKLMYNPFIPPERRPDYLPPFVPSVANTSSRSSCSTASRDPSVYVCPPAKRPRKQSTCSTPGCNGTGHKNQARWDGGHTTKAGCPLV